MQIRELLFPPGVTRHDWVLDAALAGGIGLLTIPAYGLQGVSQPSGSMQLLAAVLMVAPLLIRRHSPFLMLAGVTVAGLVQLIVSDQPMATLAVIPVVSYTIARWIPGDEARIVVVIGSIGSVLGPIRWIVTDPAYLSVKAVVSLALAWFVCMGLVITPYAIGRRAREASEASQDRLAVAEERYERLLAQREQEARLAESRARSQIARELHDIVAHSLSVMVVQAEGGRAVAAKKPEIAQEALTTIAETGREALREMRRIVGVLREDPSDSQVEYAPAPGLADISELVSRASDRASLVVHGQLPKTSAALGLTVYRVVQEALTNFLKHAGPEALARVTITYGPRDITVDVLDSGDGADAEPPETPGHGLRGMNERVVSMGGKLVARARPNGGFQVTAVLPIRS
jgi:signal transduction histidine kinase